MKNKLFICFRPVTLETDDAAPIAHHHHHHQLVNRNTRLLHTSTTYRSIHDSSRQETPLQRERRAHYDRRNIGQLNMPRSRSHHDDYCPKSLEQNSRSVSCKTCFESALTSLNKKKQENTSSVSDSIKVRRNWNLEWVVFVTTLFVTIFWGRVCGIVFMSIILYCLPRRPTNITEKRWVPVTTETDEEFKKRVIIKRWLEKNHH